MSVRAVVSCPAPLGIFEQSLALQEADSLGAMYIGFYSKMDRWPLASLPDGKLRTYLNKRYQPGLQSRYVRMRPRTTVPPEIARRVFGAGQRYDRVVFQANDRFDRWVASEVHRSGNVAFGYESSSLHTFRSAQQHGLKRVLYQPIATAESALEILGEEAARKPDLARSLRYNFFPPQELARRREERDLANAVFCASTFTRESLMATGVPANKIRILPYGVDQEVFVPNERKFRQFSVIWASSFTQTKGISYLLDALLDVPGAQLVLAGYPSGEDPVQRYEDRLQVRRLGHLGRPALAAAMARCHAHVFPTLLDGFGRNIIEAMASGLPVVATPHSAAPDLIEDGVTGFLVPIRDVDAIRERLNWLRENPAEAHAMGLRARRSVAHLTKSHYRESFAGAVHDVWAVA